MPNSQPVYDRIPQQPQSPPHPHSRLHAPPRKHPLPQSHSHLRSQPQLEPHCSAATLDPPSSSSTTSSPSALEQPQQQAPNAHCTEKDVHPVTASATATATATTTAPGTSALPAAPKASPLNVVITGGSSGIGAATVRAFANAGHRVLFTYLTGYPRARELQLQFPTTTPVHLDQGDAHSVATFAQLVHDWAADRGGVHVLINNAALGSATVQSYVGNLRNQQLQHQQQHKLQQHQHQQQQHQQQQKYHAHSHSHTHSQHCHSHSSHSHSAHDASSFPAKTNSTSPNGTASTMTVNNNASDNNNMPDTASAIDRMLRRAAADEALLKVNALGPLWVTDALLDLIHQAAETSAQRRAAVIFIGSVGGGSTAVFPEYCAADLMSKAAMTYLSKHIAARYVQHPIDVMCVSPGATETEMFRKSTLSKVGDVASFVNTMPKRRLIQPEDVAATIEWLATQSPPGLFHGANLDASMGLAVRPGLQTETENRR